MALGGLLILAVAARVLKRRGSISAQPTPAAGIPRDPELTATGVAASTGGDSATPSSTTPAQTQTQGPQTT